MPTIDILHARKGHDPVEFTTPEEAKTKIDDLIRRGYAVFAETADGTLKVKGVDVEKQEFQCVPDPAKDVRVPVMTTKITAILPQAGG